MAQLPRDATLDVTGLQGTLEVRTQFASAPLLGTDLARYYDLSYLREAIGR